MRKSRGGARLQRGDFGALKAAVGEKLARAIDAGLALGAPGLHALAQPGHLLRDPALALVLLGIGLFQRYQLLLEVGFVVAGIGSGRSLRAQLDDSLYQRIQK